MKLVQKLEIAFGLATLILTIAYFCLNMLPYVKFRYENDGAFSSAIVLVSAFGMIVIPSVLTAVGAYFWATKRSSLGFGMVVSGALATSLVAVAFFASAMFYFQGFVVISLIVLQFIFAILALIYAFQCRRIFLAPR